MSSRGRVGSCHGPVGSWSGREGKVALPPFWVEMPPPPPPAPAAISLAVLIRAGFPPKMYPLTVIAESRSGQVMSRSGHGGVGSGGEACIATFLGGDASSPPPPTLAPLAVLIRACFPPRSVSCDSDCRVVVGSCHGRVGSGREGLGRMGHVALPHFGSSFLSGS